MEIARIEPDRPRLEGPFDRGPADTDGGVGESFTVESFSSARHDGVRMDKGQNSGGLMSSAGLVRYFDTEDSNAIRIDPKTVIAIGVMLGVIVQLLTFVS